MSNILSAGVVGSRVIAVVLAGAAASMVACSQGEPDTTSQKQAWSCGTEQVPMGEAVRCTTSAMSVPVTETPSVDETTSYECDSAGVDCPPADVGTTGETSGTGGASDTSDTPPECGYVPDLDYCPPGSSDDATSGSGATECGKPKCTPPGQEKKAGSDGESTSSSSSSSSSSGGSGGGKAKGKDEHWKCTKDGAGQKTCTSTPDCAPGTHAAACGACVPDSEGSTSDCVPPSEGGCWVTGGGFIEGASLVPAAPADGHDNFGGNAKPMKNGTVNGHWNHVDHGTGNHAKGRPEYIVCRHVDEPGPGQPGGKKGLTANQVYFGGHAQWRSGDAWSDGYWFDVVAKDHGEPGSSAATKKGGMPDSYHFTIRKIDDPTLGASGKVVYETRGELSGGNIQMHPSNNGHPATTSPLPAWVSFEP